MRHKNCDQKFFFFTSSDVFSEHYSRTWEIELPFGYITATIPYRYPIKDKANKKMERSEWWLKKTNRHLIETSKKKTAV